jgi:peroxiredoxin (alkyl hydroperoxide reductase subunit C)
LGDTVTGLSAWSKQAAETFGIAVNFPLGADPDHVVTQAAGMEHPKEIDGYAIRKSFLIDPSLRIRMIFEYSVFVGRNMDEVLRVIDALKLVDGVGSPRPADGGRVIRCCRRAPVHRHLTQGRP